MSGYEYSKPITIECGINGEATLYSAFGTDSEAALLYYATADTAGSLAITFDGMSGTPNAQTSQQGMVGYQFSGPTTIAPQLYWIPVKDTIKLVTSGFTKTYTLVIVWRRCADVTIPQSSPVHYGDLTA